MLKPKKSIENMSGYFVPLYENHWDVKIDSNENNYGASPKVIEAIKTCDYKDISFYPYYGELSQKIADYRGCSIENIKVTNGADEAIAGIIQTYLEQDEMLITLDVSFDMPGVYTQIQGGKIIKVAYEEKWKFPTQNFINTIRNNDKIKVIYIASPNNPTGSTIEENDLSQILEYSKNKVVIIDETYANYTNITYQKYIHIYDNIFIVRSFSKDFALAGLRLGYVISNSENINNLKKVISPYSVNAIALKAGIAALSDIEYFEKIKAEILQTKENLAELFENYGAKVYSSNANFLLVDFGEKAEFIYKALKKANISVKLYKKGSNLSGHLRVTIPTKMGLQKLTNAIRIKPLLVFDMDGVLIDAKSYRETIAKVYEKYTGKTVSQYEIQSIKNSGGMNNDWDLTQYLLKKEGVNVSYEEIVTAFQSIYWNNGQGLINLETPLFEKNVFEELSQRYNLAIFTGRPREEAIFALERFGILDMFYPVITADDIPRGEGKPNSYGLNKLKEKVNCTKSYYFGDTKDDIICAKGANVIPIGVLPPQDKSEELKVILKTMGAKLVINTVNDILSILGQENEIV